MCFADKITENVGFEKGVMDLKVDMAGKTVYIKYNPDKTNPETLKKAIEKLGYSAEVKNAPTECTEKSCCKKDNAESKGTCCKKDTANSKCCKKDGCKKDDAKSGCCKKDETKKECCKKDGGCKDSAPKEDCRK